MSSANVDSVRAGYEHFLATGEFAAHTVWPEEFVWDMSTFSGWPENPEYRGSDGFNQFMSQWLEAWDDWELEILEYVDAPPDKVVTTVRQRGVAKAGGVPTEMRFGQVWTLRDAKSVRMEMYASPDEAKAAAGLAE